MLIRERFSIKNLHEGSSKRAEKWFKNHDPRHNLIWVIPAEGNAMITFSLLDYLIIIFYVILVIGIGFITLPRSTNMESFLLMGRKLTLPLFIGSLVSTWYGGIIGVGEISYSSGLYNWLTQGFFWYLSYIVFALFLAKRLQTSHQYTLPDQLEIFYGKTARKIGLILNFFNVVPIAYIISLGILIQLSFGIPLKMAIVLGGFISVIYTFFGGFSADVYTDFLQFIFMCVGVALMIPFAFFKLGGWSYLVTHVPASHFSLTGGLPLTEILIWGFIAMTTLVDPNFYQRCYAASTPEVAKKGILLSVLFWMLFDICTTFAGIYARAALPGIDPKHSFPLLAELILPSGIKGIYFTAMLATIMSTIDSYCFVAATTLSRDLYQKTFFPQASEKNVIWVTRIGIILVATLAVVLGFGLYDSIKKVWKLFGSMMGSTLLIPLMFGFWYRGPKKKEAGVASMIGGFLGGALFYIGDKFFKIPLCQSIEPLYPGLTVSLLTFMIFNRRKS